MAKITRRQVIESVIFALLGTAPGVALYLLTSLNMSLVAAVLGAFVGFALSLPGVSAKRIAAGTALAIVASNSTRGSSIISDAMDRDEPDEETESQDKAE